MCLRFRIQCWDFLLESLSDSISRVLYLSFCWKYSWKAKMNNNWLYGRFLFPFLLPSGFYFRSLSPSTSIVSCTWGYESVSIFQELGLYVCMFSIFISISYSFFHSKISVYTFWELIRLYANFRVNTYSQISIPSWHMLFLNLLLFGSNFQV